jgi:HK97 family phage major capsid protein
MVENSDMDGTWNVAATADNYILLYGDFSNFIIADRIGSTLETVPNVMGANNRPTGERGALRLYR